MATQKKAPAKKAAAKKGTTKRSPRKTAPAKPAIDKETRDAFVSGEGVPGPGSVTRDEPVDIMAGIEVQKGADPFIPDATHTMPNTLALLTDKAARELQPTSPDSIGTQCDVLGIEADQTVSWLGSIRSDFVIRDPSKLHPETLKSYAAKLERLATQAIQLRNSIVTHG